MLNVLGMKASSTLIMDKAGNLGKERIFYLVYLIYRLAANNLVRCP